MISTRWMYRCASGLALIGSAAFTGCVASSPVPASAVSSPSVDDEDATADLTEHGRHHHQGGVTMFIALSLDTLGLPATQQTVVQNIQTDLFAKMEPARAAEQDLLYTLADGIAAGTIDKTRVEPKLKELERTAGQIHEAAADTLNKLHDALTPPQRAALVDKVKAHWAVFRKANGEEDQVGKDKPKGRLADLTAEVGLTPDQVGRIRMALETGAPQAPPGATDPAEIQAHLDRLNTFRDDNFDARTLAGGAIANTRLTAGSAARMARFYEAVDPALTPEQRAKLAGQLREHAAHKDAAFVAAH
jgi:Spy/CpxP family protein refolding chaperone